MHLLKFLLLGPEQSLLRIQHAFELAEDLHGLGVGHQLVVYLLHLLEQLLELLRLFLHLLLARAVVSLQRGEVLLLVLGPLQL